MAERQFGPYRLVRQIAVGGMAEIHLAKTKGIAGFEKYVALKMIHPNFAEDDQFIQMLVDEAKIAVQLTHGNIAQTFDLGRVGDTYYITMEYVDGADLYRILRRGSEHDYEMALDVCAFIGKEIASALDHAHRKRDTFGKNLGIVHRDVSPQNVLISYSGEVKLVDFGIAKATSKARQTAVGVIKGKYYYMSPEQAWGEPLDYRSDIFSAGIVLYEMITGQMLYLEEDLMKLLEMARNAEIAPPSKLRKGVPPQLERIVMHALQKNPADRYQSASDLAADLERFLHAYSPVFTAGKIAGMIKAVLGDPTAPAPAPDDEYSMLVNVSDAPAGTHSLDIGDLIHDREELRDENSVIFSVDELKAKGAAANRAAAPAPAKGAAPTRSMAPALAQASAPAAAAGKPNPARPIPGSIPPPVGPARARAPTAPQKPMGAAGVIPSIAKPPAARPPGPAPARGGAAPAAPVVRAPMKPAPRPRQLDEHTRQLEQVPGRAGTEDSGLLDVAGAEPDSTMVGDPMSRSFFDASEPGEDGGDATVVTSAPLRPDTGLFESVGDGAGDAGDTHEGGDTSDDELPTSVGGRLADSSGFDDGAETMARGARMDDDQPTMARARPMEGRARPAPRARVQPPAALAAKIQTPAVSELRKPKASRRTPPDGVPAKPNVLQQLVGGPGGGAPMPAPAARPATPRSAAPTAPPPLPREAPAPAAPPAPAQFPHATPGAQAPYATQPSPYAPYPPPPDPQAMPPYYAATAGSGPYAATAGSGPYAATAGSGPYAATAGSGPYAGNAPYQPQPGYPPAAPPPGYPDPAYQAPPPAGYAAYPQGAPYQPGHPPGYPPPGSQAGYPPQASQAGYLPPGSQAGYPPPGSQAGYPPPGSQAAYQHQPPSAYPPQAAPGWPSPNPSEQVPLNPSSLYPFSQQNQQNLSLTGQLRLSEVDEMPSMYKLGRSQGRWVLYIGAAIAAVLVAAIATFAVVRSTRSAAPTSGNVSVDSAPAGAEIVFDDVRLADKTPFLIKSVPVGTKHSIRVELPRHKPYIDSVEIPENGAETPVMALLKPITGKLVVTSRPPGADVLVDGQLRGRTPTTLVDVDMGSAKRLELRLKDHAPVVQDLTWPESGEIELDVPMPEVG